MERVWRMSVAQRLVSPRREKRCIRHAKHWLLNCNCRHHHRHRRRRRRRCRHLIWR